MELQPELRTNGLNCRSEPFQRERGSLRQTKDFDKEVGEPLFVLDHKEMRGAVRHIPVTDQKYPVIPAGGLNRINPQVSNNYSSNVFF